VKDDPAVRYLEGIATADVAFEACGATLEETFLAAADATLNVMVEEIGTVAPTEHRGSPSPPIPSISSCSNSSRSSSTTRTRPAPAAVRDLRIEESGTGFRLHADAIGETIDPERHSLLADVKAVTLHRLVVERIPDGWRAVVVLDV